MQGRCSGQQLGDAVDGMVGDAADHLAQIGFGIEAVELGGFDEGVGMRRRARRRRRIRRTDSSSCPERAGESRAEKCLDSGGFLCNVIM
jgi:hypothetical protein